MVELVDTRDLGSRALGRAGSTPVPGTFNLPLRKRTAKRTLSYCVEQNYLFRNEWKPVAKPIRILLEGIIGIIPSFKEDPF